MSNQFVRHPPRPEIRIDLDGLHGERELGRLARLWFELGWESIGGWLREQLILHPLPDLEVTDDLLAGRIDRHYPAEGRPFMLLAGSTDTDEVQNWNRLYNDVAMRDFLGMAEKVPTKATMVLGGLVQTDNDLPWPRQKPGRPTLNVSLFRAHNPYWLSLWLSADKQFLFDDLGQQSNLLAFLRRFADEADPPYGECGLPISSSRAIAADYALPCGVASYQESRATLRSFSWLTLVPKELVPKLASAEQLRRTGAFAEVSTLRMGGLWLLATERFEEFDRVAAKRVFETLEPVLPQGLRDDYGQFEDCFSWTATTTR